MALPFHSDAAGITIRVRLTPRGGRDAVDGVEMLSDGTAVLKARVRAAPENGSANAALEELLAKTLGVPKSTVEVTKGAGSRVKTVRISGAKETLRKLIERL